MDIAGLDEICADRYGRRYRISDNTYVVGFDPAHSWSDFEDFFAEKPGADQIRAKIKRDYECMAQKACPEKKVEAFMCVLWPFADGWKANTLFGEAAYTNIVIESEPF